ncbi:hypothetical protein NESM_000837800 [Novymonas esmeraldas]|uniref:Uncharacterized protein n=1 Tax=Novymonas esmeraldas TaxID=1808958 RepID=A0AAW0EXK0_9TRYP
MAEIEFEETCRELSSYLETVRQCQRRIARIPGVLAQLLELLSDSTKLLEDLSVPEEVSLQPHRRCSRSHRLMRALHDGAGLTELMDSIQATVHHRLARMEELVVVANSACKRRRDARAQYLNATGRRRSFHMAASKPEKVQRCKEEYTASDAEYRETCTAVVHYRVAAMGLAQADFSSAYSGVFALLKNALSGPGGAVSQCASTATRQRLRGIHQRLSGDSDDTGCGSDRTAGSLPPLNGPPPAVSACVARGWHRPSSHGGDRPDGQKEEAGSVATAAGSAPVEGWSQAGESTAGVVMAGIPMVGNAASAPDAPACVPHSPPAATAAPPPPPAATAPDPDTDSSAVATDPSTPPCLSTSSVLRHLDELSSPDCSSQPPPPQEQPAHLLEYSLLSSFADT